MLTRITIVMGLIALCTTFLFKEVKNVQLGRQENLPAFKLDQDISKKKYDGLIQLVTADKHKGFCSGFVVSKEYAITAAHCLVNEDSKMKDSESIKARSVKFVDESGNTQQLITPVEIVGLNLATDYALLIGDFSEFSAMKIETGAAAIRGIQGVELLPGIVVPLFAVGFPFGGAEAMAFAQERCETVGDMFMCKGIMFRGCSGGPIIDPVTGTVYGLNHAINMQGQETFFKFLIALFDQFNVETY
jgi:hypothetical protein